MRFPSLGFGSAVRSRPTRIFGLAILAAVLLACIVSSVTFPALAGVDVRTVLPAVLATATAVAIPIVMVLTSLSRSADQVVEMTAREALSLTAHEIGYFGYWVFDKASGTIGLSGTLQSVFHEDGNAAGNLTLDAFLDRVAADDRAVLREAFTGLRKTGIFTRTEVRIRDRDDAERVFWLHGIARTDRLGRVVGAYGACQDVSEHKRTEAALRESEDHHRSAVELNAQISWTADARGNVEEIGPRWEDHVGMPLAVARGSGWTAALHPDDLAPVMNAWNRALETGESYDTEYRLMTADGGFGWFRARAACRRDADGRIVRWYGTLEDVNDRRVADAALRESEAFARSVLQSTRDCIKIIDLDGRVQFMNAPGLRTMEIDCSRALIGREWDALWPEAERAGLRAALDAARKGVHSRFQGFCPTAKGTPKWWDVSVSPFLDEHGRPDRFLAISRDMTDMKEAQDRIARALHDARDLARQLETVLASTTDCVIMLDRDFVVRYANPRAKAFCEGDRIPDGRDLDRAFPCFSQGHFRARLEDAFRHGRSGYFEEYLDARGIWVEVHVYPGDDRLSLFFKDVSEKHRAHEKLLYLAHHDPLTGLANRSVLAERIEAAGQRARANGPSVLLLVDLDDFKSVNDLHGHAAGDALLRQVSERLVDCAGPAAVVARLGGDEFAVLSDGDDRAGAALSRAVLDAFRAPFTVENHAIQVGASIGVAVLTGREDMAGKTLRDADIALYKAKAEGRGTYCLYTDALGEAYQEEESLKSDLKSALANGELHVEYQPIMCTTTGRPTAFEALVRWRHPAKGLLMPSLFIPLAEQSGQIADIGAWVLDRACRDAATWPDDIAVAVNFSPAQFRAGDVVQKIERCLLGSGLPGHRLQVEITESTMMEDTEPHLEALNDIRLLGARISLDDFGTGFSSLSYLRSFPIDKVKIDRSFVSDISDSTRHGGSDAIIRASVELADSLGMRTAAEGVETLHQLAMLRATGCTEVQGFLIGRPVPAERVPDAIRQCEASSPEFLSALRPPDPAPSTGQGFRARLSG